MAIWQNGGGRAGKHENMGFLGGISPRNPIARTPVMSRRSVKAVHKSILRQRTHISPDNLIFIN